MEIHVKVFRGGKDARQALVYDTVVGDVYSKFISNGYTFRVESKNVREIKDLNWTSEQLSNWLNEGDLYLVLSHPHQGLEVLNWNMNQLENNLFDTLKGKCGFPSGLKLKCPIFLQDKV